jgi:O-antigen/teichoic acid export membrane protein
MSRKDRPGLTEHRSLGRVARTSVMWAYVRTFAVGIVGVPSTIILARLLSPADFGIAAAATFFGQLASKLSSGGFGMALVRLKELRSEHISTVFVINLAASLIGTVALVVAAPSIGRFYGAPEIGWILPVVALNFVLGALSMVQQSLLSRDLRYREMATIGSIDTLVAAVSAVVFAWYGFRFWSLVLGDVCGAFAKWIGGVYYAGWHVRLRFVPAAAREMASFALGSYVRKLLEHGTRNIDNIVIGRFLGVTSLGFYDKAFSIGNKVFNKMTVVGPSVSFRIFSIIQDDPERFRRAFRKVIMTVTLLGYLVFAGLGTMAPHLIVVALGENWRMAVIPFQLLCVAFGVKILNQYAIAAAQARGWVWPQIWRQLVQIACIVIGVYLAIPWGINGAAFAVLAATITMFFLLQSMMRKATGLGWADVMQPQVPALASASLLVAVLWSIDLLCAGAAPALVLVLQAGAAAVFMLAFAWWCPFKDARVLMHEVVNDLSPRTAAFVWSDIAATRKAAKAARSKSTQPTVV